MNDESRDEPGFQCLTLLKPFDEKYQNLSNGLVTRLIRH